MQRIESERVITSRKNNKKIPTYCGRKMEEIKKYPNFILFQDPKTKIKSCFFYEEIGREDEKEGINAKK